MNTNISTVVGTAAAVTGGLASFAAKQLQGAAKDIMQAVCIVPLRAAKTGITNTLTKEIAERSITPLMPIVEGMSNSLASMCQWADYRAINERATEVLTSVANEIPNQMQNAANACVRQVESYVTSSSEALTVIAAGAGCVTLAVVAWKIYQACISE